MDTIRHLNIFQYNIVIQLSNFVRHYVTFVIFCLEHVEIYVTVFGFKVILRTQKDSFPYDMPVNLSFTRV